jgi:hypothetical protein
LTIADDTMRRDPSDEPEIRLSRTHWCGKLPTYSRKVDTARAGLEDATCCSAIITEIRFLGATRRYQQADTAASFGFKQVMEYNIWRRIEQIL